MCIRDRVRESTISRPACGPNAIATGEGLFSRFEFKQLLDVKGAAIIQPDVMHAGGVTELRKIANMAEAYGVEAVSYTHLRPFFWVG